MSAGLSEDKVRTITAPNDLMACCQDIIARFELGSGETYDSENVHVYGLGFRRIHVVLRIYMRQLSIHMAAFLTTDSECGNDSLVVICRRKGR